jgi:hypothetical protein
MAYDAKNLNLTSARMGEGENAANAGYSSASWVYRDSGGDVLATMIADNYITDGDDQGIKVGDMIAFIETGVAAQWHIVDSISAAGLVAVTAFT